MDHKFVTPSLLPPPLRKDAHQRALEALSAKTADLPVHAVLVNDFDAVDASALPHLAEQLNCLGDLGWELCGEDPAAQRAYLKSVVSLKRAKGTPHAVREIFRLLGLGEVQLHEGTAGKLYDGSLSHFGATGFNGSRPTWAAYSVTVDALMTIQMSERIGELLARWAPARCKFLGVETVGSKLIYNGFATQDGTYTYGAN